jgi:hypothetical protein
MKEDKGGIAEIIKKSLKKWNRKINVRELLRDIDLNERIILK